jgi:predicted nucleic acid-binding protein
MIVYADTSALVKLFVTEEGSEATRDMLRQAQAIGETGKQEERGQSILQHL